MYNPVPMAVTSASKRNNGSHSIRQSGTNCVKIIMTTRIKKEIKKSIRQTITVLAGTINRGKYTFVSRFELATNEPLASLKAEEKNCQGKVAVQTNRILETPCGTSE